MVTITPDIFPYYFRRTQLSVDKLYKVIKNLIEVADDYKQISLDATCIGCLRQLQSGLYCDLCRKIFKSGKLVRMNN